MSISLQASPSTTAQRGEATIQPAYFTSSIFVKALREDIQSLANNFSERYYKGTDTVPESSDLRPFALFKELWIEMGWQWLHLKILEPRARESFLYTVLRLFAEECTKHHEKSIHRITGLFGMYIFFMTQPSSSVPRKMQTIDGIPMPQDLLQLLYELPNTLGERELSLKPVAIHILDTLRPIFYILPKSDLFTQNPRILPREVVRDEVILEEGASSKKKTGRPSKSEKAHRIRAAVTGLERWLEKSSYPVNNVLDVDDPAGAAKMWKKGKDAEHDGIYTEGGYSTHIMLSQRPMATLNSYRSKKEAVIQTLEDTKQREALDRAGERVVRRLREIDAAAADQGLEVGTEGGDLSAIERVEAAVAERASLTLLEGGGLHVTESVATL